MEYYQYFEEERRRNGPKMGLPFGLGVFRPSSSLLVAHIPNGMLAPRASKLGQNTPSKCQDLLGTQHSPDGAVEESLKGPL
jgi:hypothetical protein